MEDNLEKSFKIPLYTLNVLLSTSHEASDSLTSFYESFLCVKGIFMYSRCLHFYLYFFSEQIL